jgi:hypothetical protein
VGSVLVAAALCIGGVGAFTLARSHSMGIAGGIIDAARGDLGAASTQVAALEPGIAVGVGPARPARTPDLLPADARELLCFYEFASLPPDAPLTCNWAQPGMLAAPVPSDCWRPEKTAACAKGVFVLKAPSAAGMSVGIHQLDISDATGSVDQASFVIALGAAGILNASAPNSQETRVLSAVVTGTVAPDGSPGPASAVFAQTGRVNLVFRYQGAESGMTFAVDWYADGERISQAHQDVVITAPDGWGRAWIQAGPASPLPSAEYEATVSLPGAPSPAARVTFSVKQP